MTVWILAKHEAVLKKLEVYYALRATQYGVEVNHHMFLALVEMYNCYTGTFFVPVREIDLALHEMYEISKLPWGTEPYEKYTPRN